MLLVSNAERPVEAKTRMRIGDLEVDLMMSAKHKTELIVLTDRVSLEVDMIKLNSKKAQEVKEKIIKRLSKRKAQLHTLTFDNGLEFAKHEQIAKALSVDTCFTRPYTSQDKDSVENKIGIIRSSFLRKQI